MNRPARTSRFRPASRWRGARTRVVPRWRPQPAPPTALVVVRDLLRELPSTYVRRRL